MELSIDKIFRSIVGTLLSYRGLVLAIPAAGVFSGLGLSAMGGATPGWFGVGMVGLATLGLTASSVRRHACGCPSCKRRQPPMGRRCSGTESVWVMEDRNNNNARMQIVSRVAAVQPTHSLAVELSSPTAFRGSASYTLTDLGGGQTRLESEGRYIFDNWFARVMTPVVLALAKTKAAGDLAHLRQLVEVGR